MLVDLPKEFVFSVDDFYRDMALITNPSMTEEQLTMPPRLAQGIYLGHLNTRLFIQHLIKSEYPFSDDAREHMAKNQELLKLGQEVIPYDWENWPADFGVCDNYAQILAKWPSIETDPRHFQIWLSEIKKEEQSPHGGWRWHKWGPYIGVHEPQHEYLYDEDGIDSVLLFLIIEVNF